jgi:hypothetical protein
VQPEILAEVHAQTLPTLAGRSSLGDLAPLAFDFDGAGDFDSRMDVLQQRNGLGPIHALAGVLDDLRDDLSEDARRGQDIEAWSVKRAEGVVVAVSAGLVGMLLRGSSLVAVALSALPFWRRVDPLAVLALSEEERDKLRKELQAAQDAEDSKEKAVGQLLDEESPQARV